MHMSGRILGVLGLVRICFPNRKIDFIYAGRKNRIQWGLPLWQADPFAGLQVLGGHLITDYPLRRFKLSDLAHDFLIMQLSRLRRL